MMQKDPKLIVFEVKANGRRSDIALAPIAFGAGAMSFDQMPWSPDGAWLPYLGPTADPNVAAVQVWSVKTGQSRPLGVEVDARGWMKWSPDGQRLAIRVQRSAAHVDEVRIVTLATGESHVLAGPGFGVVGKWTTNDRLVLRHANPQNPSVTDVLMFPVAGGASIKICAETTGGDVCGVSWNGRYVLRLSSDTKRYFIREIPDGKEQPVTRASGEETGMFFSPDDRLLFFYSNRDGHWAPYVATADRFPIEKPVKIGELNSAPGNSLASLNGITGNVILGYVVQDGNVSRLELDPRTGRAVAGASMERLTQDAQYNDRPVMSPDGTLIAYRFRNYGKGGIGVMDASGANEQHLLEFPRPLSGPLFWRSKDEVLFAAGSGPDRSVSALNIRTGAVSVVRQLHIEAGWEYVPGRDEVLTAPDGPAAAGAPVFEAVSLATGTKRVIKAGTAAGDVIDLWFVSPDGKQIAYTVWRHSGPETRTELRVMNIDGTGDRVLIPMGTDELAPAAWSRDGRFILYDPDYGGERARVLNVATGESWALLERGLSWDSEGSWAPDGSFLVVTTSESRRVWQMLEGITYDAVAKLMKK
jgi:Tol biopolymer transport system component